MANEIKYKDQVWGDNYSIKGEQLSVNAYYCGHKVGTPMQDAKAPAETNKDKYYREHNQINCGTITQDSAANANMPEEDKGE